MSTIAFHILTILVSAGGTEPAVPANSVLAELVTQGVAMPDGHVIQLDSPSMSEGLNAIEQTKVLKEVAPRRDLDRFMAKQSDAPVAFRIRTLSSNKPGDLIRKIDVHFVVYGDWKVLTGKRFANGILKADKAKNQKGGDTEVIKAGYLKPPELAVRGLTERSTPNLREYYLYTTFKLFAQVQVSATRFAVATKTPTGVVIAAKVDPRFAMGKEKEYPNQWCPIIRDAQGNSILGPPQPYSGAGFYAKVTRLVQPADAIFVEYHSAFYEPSVGWFGSGNENLLPSELHKIVPYQVKQFRIKLATATKKAAEAKAAGLKDATDAEDTSEEPAPAK